MTVSVLIPSRNPGEHIVAAIRSAKAQPETSEIIVADAGSTDGSALLASELGATVITLGDIGQVAARNELARRASSEWVQWLDADDYLLPGKLAAQLAIIGDGDVAYCDVQMLYPDGQREARHLAALEPFTAAALGAAVAVHAYLTRADMVRAVPFDPDFETGGCVSKWALDLTAAGATFVHVPIVGCVYRRSWSDQQTTADRTTVAAGYARFRTAVAQAGITPRVSVPSSEDLELA